VTICRRLDEWKSVSGETLPVSPFHQRQPPSLLEIVEATYRYRYVLRLVRCIDRPTGQMPDLEIGIVDERMGSRKAKIAIRCRLRPGQIGYHRLGYTCKTSYEAFLPTRLGDQLAMGLAEWVGYTTAQVCSDKGPMRLMVAATRCGVPTRAPGGG
jgi:hypothetical protein